MTQKKKLETMPMWQHVSKIADYIDTILPAFPEEEQWGVTSKLRNRAFDITSDIAEGFGAIDPRDKKWHFGLARRSLFGVKNALRVASRRGYVSVDPNIMIMIDKVVDEIDQMIQQATQDIPRWLEEMNPSARKVKQ